eukprot:gene13847-18571_t
MNSDFEQISYDISKTDWLIKLKNNSKIVSELFSEDVNVYAQLIQDYSILERLYLDSFDYNAQEIVIVTNLLHFLDCDILIEFLTYQKAVGGYDNDSILSFNNDLQQLYHNIPSVIIHNKDQLFQYLCRNGFYSAMKWTWNHFHHESNNEDQATTISNNAFQISFGMACAEGHLSIASYLYSNMFGGYQLHENFLNHEIFQLVCTKGHLEVAKWLYDQGQVDIHANNESTFIAICAKGQLEIAMWLYNLGGVDIHVNNDEPFIKACRHGQLEMSQWLYSLNGFNHLLSTCFTIACKEDRLNVAQWLYSLGGVGIDVEEVTILMFVAEGQLELIKWLHSLGRFTIRNDYFLIACRRGHLEFAKWLYDFGGIDIINDTEIFLESCLNGRLDVAIWLYNISGSNIVVDFDELLQSVCKKGMLPMAKWLYSISTINIRDKKYRKFKNKDISNWILELQER